MWQQNCLLRKFGLLKSCQPITGQRPTDRQNPVLISLAYLLRLRLVPSELTTRLSYLFLSEKVPTCLSVKNTIIPKWFDNLLFTCFSVRQPQPASRLGLSDWPNRAMPGWPPAYSSPLPSLSWGPSKGNLSLECFLIPRPWLLPIVSLHTLQCADNIQLQFFLHPLCLPVVISSGRTNQDILSSCLYLARTWNYTIHLARERLIKLMNLN